MSASKDYQTGICCFSDKNSAFWSENKHWLSLSPDKMSVLSNICFSILQTIQYIYTHYSDIFTIRAPDNFLVGGAISPYFLKIRVFLLKKKILH
jgi:hypothetical protein